VGTIVALGLAAAIYPQLLAVVVVILTRPNPKRLLLACYVGSVCLGVGCAAAVLVAFRNRDHVFGSTSHRLGPASYLILGAVALLFAAFAATKRGRELLGGDRAAARADARERRQARHSVRRAKQRAEQALEQGSFVAAAVIGAILGLPGPFDLLAFGHMARGGYSTVALVVPVAVFIFLKFLLIEIPIAGYTIAPDGTAARVDRFSAWMKANKIAVIATVVAVIGVVLVSRGVSRLG
jgi:hypothetical protein